MTAIYGDSSAAVSSEDAGSLIMISFKSKFICLKLNQDFQNSIHIFRVRLRFLELIN